MLKLTSISKRFGGLSVLQDVNIEVPQGSIFGLIGPNGAGKTTLVSLIAGSNVPTSGTITRHARVKIGRYCQQSVEEITTIASSDPRLTALRYVMSIDGGKMEEKEARQILSGLGLHGQTVSDVPLMLLSGGQKVKVVLGAATWRRPHVICLDEPTSACYFYRSICSGSLR